MFSRKIKYGENPAESNLVGVYEEVYRTTVSDRTGRPVNRTLLSAKVIGKFCRLHSYGKETVEYLLR